MLSKFIDGLFGYSYYQVIRGPQPSSSLWVVERVDVVLWIKFYTLVCFTSDVLARAKVEKYNGIYAPKWLNKDKI